MKILLSFILVVSSLSTFAYSAKMSKQCEQKIAKEIGEEGSVQSSTKDIIAVLKNDWKSNPTKDVAHYDDCGSSDYFIVDVLKETCEVKVEAGDSDGECY